MNINLSAAASSKKKKDGKNKLSYGLNKPKKSNVFGDDDSESDEEEAEGTNPSTSTARSAVNRDIAAEQEALRKRAQQAMANATNDSLYDYDGAYESFKPNKEEEEKQKEAAPEERKSRYIQDLLKQSKKREIEREAILERKIAREQAEEDAQAEYQGKEKFITKGEQTRNKCCAEVSSGDFF